MVTYGKKILVTGAQLQVEDFLTMAVKLRVTGAKAQQVVFLSIQETRNLSAHLAELAKRAGRGGP